MHFNLIHTLYTQAIKKREMEMKEAKNKSTIEELKVTVPSVGISQSHMQIERPASSLSESSVSSEHSGRPNALL